MGTLGYTSKKHNKDIFLITKTSLGDAGNTHPYFIREKDVDDGT
jgi:hypothetical protein